MVSLTVPWLVRLGRMVLCYLKIYESENKTYIDRELCKEAPP
jgi:hypothetical protein